MSKKKSPFRKIQSLNKVLNDHHQWLRTDGKEGKKADLSYADLRREKIEYADLSFANLEGANLELAEIDYTNFGSANFTDASLHSASIIGCRFPDANLINTFVSDTYFNLCSLERARFDRSYWFRAKVTDSDLSGVN